MYSYILTINLNNVKYLTIDKLMWIKFGSYSQRYYICSITLKQNDMNFSFKNEVITLEEAKKMTAFGVYTRESKLNNLTYVTIDVQDWDDFGNFKSSQVTYILKTW